MADESYDTPSTFQIVTILYCRGKSSPMCSFQNALFYVKVLVMIEHNDGTLFSLSDLIMYASQERKISTKFLQKTCMWI